MSDIIYRNIFDSALIYKGKGIYLFLNLGSLMVIRNKLHGAISQNGHDIYFSMYITS